MRVKHAPKSALGRLAFFERKSEFKEGPRATSKPQSTISFYSVFSEAEYKEDPVDPLEGSLELPESSRSATLYPDPGPHWSPKRPWGVIFPLWGVIVLPGEHFASLENDFSLLECHFSSPRGHTPTELARRFVRSD